MKNELKKAAEETAEKENKKNKKLDAPFADEK
jgi:hypothetical protein